MCVLQIYLILLKLEKFGFKIWSIQNLGSNPSLHRYLSGNRHHRDQSLMQGPVLRLPVTLTNPDRSGRIAMPESGRAASWVLDVTACPRDLPELQTKVQLLVLPGKSTCQCPIRVELPNCVVSVSLRCQESLGQALPCV